MNNDPPLQETFFGQVFQWTRGWTAFFTQLKLALRGITGTSSLTTSIDFGAVPANGRLASAVEMDAAQPGDFVLVQSAGTPAGLFFIGECTVAGTVNVFAYNTTGTAINPPSLAFKILVIQI